MREVPTFEAVARSQGAWSCVQPLQEKHARMRGAERSAAPALRRRYVVAGADPSLPSHANPRNHWPDGRFRLFNSRPHRCALSVTGQLSRRRDLPYPHSAVRQLQSNDLTPYVRRASMQDGLPERTLDPATVKTAERSLLTPHNEQRMKELLEALCDPTRVKVVRALRDDACGRRPRACRQPEPLRDEAAPQGAARHRRRG
jgi:hypothetical protein